MSSLRRLLSAVQQLHKATPVLRDYAPWPGDLVEQPLPSASCPVARDFPQMALADTDQTRPVIEALRAAAPDLQWKQTYTEDEVGAHFLQSYGYVELFGPSGHFRSTQLRGYLGYWGPGLTYDWHSHQAEELYFALAGRSAFAAKGAANVYVKPGEARQHESHQPHLMMTLDQPYLTYAIWRGEGMADKAALIKAA